MYFDCVKKQPVKKVEIASLSKSAERQICLLFDVVSLTKLMAVLLSLAMILMIPEISQAKQQKADSVTLDSSQADNANILKEAFHNIIEADVVDDNQIARYFSKDYVQHVDGKTINYDQFVSHMHTQRKTLMSIKVTFLNVVSKGDIVFTNHIITAHTKDGRVLQGKVIGEFTIKDGQIIACDELTYMINRTEEDRDLGSRHE